MKFRARKEGRKLVYNYELVAKYLERWPENTVFKCEIVRPQKTESDPMRRYYFAVVLPLFMDHIGYDRDEKDLFHYQLKMLYFDPQPDEFGFVHVPTVFSKKSKLPVSDKHKFVEWVRRKGAEAGVYIPDPNEEL